MDGHKLCGWTHRYDLHLYVCACILRLCCVDSQGRRSLCENVLRQRGWRNHLVGRNALQTTPNAEMLSRLRTHTQSAQPLPKKLCNLYFKGHAIHPSCSQSPHAKETANDLQRHGWRRHWGRVCENQTAASSINLVTCLYLLYLCSFTQYLLLSPISSFSQQADKQEILHNVRYSSCKLKMMEVLYTAVQKFMFI